MSKSVAWIAAAIALPGVALIAVPALAAPPAPGPAPAVVSPASCGDSQLPSHDDAINDEESAQIGAALKAEGYKVSGVEDFGGCVRAYVTGANGQTTMEYFTRSPLRQILPSG